MVQAIDRESRGQGDCCVYGYQGRKGKRNGAMRCHVGCIGCSGTPRGAARRQTVPWVSADSIGKTRYKEVPSAVQKGWRPRCVGAWV